MNHEGFEFRQFLKAPVPRPPGLCEFPRPAKKKVS